jgi:hypothetical protein
LRLLEKIRSKSFALFAVLALIIVLVTALNLDVINRQLHAWKLLPQPQNVTELYFTDHRKLPASYTPGETQQVAFSIRNNSDRDVTYTYVVNEQSEDGKQYREVTRRAILVPRNSTQSIDIPVVRTDFGDRARVGIFIANSNQTINYWTRRAAL